MPASHCAITATMTSFIRLGKEAGSLYAPCWELMRKSNVNTTNLPCKALPTICSLLVSWLLRIRACVEAFLPSFHSIPYAHYPARLKHLNSILHPLWRSQDTSDLAIEPVLADAQLMKTYSSRTESYLCSVVPRRPNSGIEYVKLAWTVSLSPSLLCHPNPLYDPWRDIELKLSAPDQSAAAGMPVITRFIGKSN